MIVSHHGFVLVQYGSSSSLHNNQLRGHWHLAELHEQDNLRP